ncbi:MAG: hypothetical protein Q9M36_02925, partial [Sulfurovum sp.]|nr:hypothetical protein [Sulfurovum sp.]
VNGVIYDPNPLRIGDNSLAVPKAFWKMISNEAEGYKECFLYQNDLNAITVGDTLESHLVDCYTDLDNIPKSTKVIPSLVPIIFAILF